MQMIWDVMTDFFTITKLSYSNNYKCLFSLTIFGNKMEKNK